MKKEIREAQKEKLAKLEEKLSWLYEIKKSGLDYNEAKITNIEKQIGDIKEDLKKGSLWHNPNPWIFHMAMAIIVGILAFLLGRLS